ncbi:MAG: hypothetical protein JW787_03020 [Sedimentisphaerales bacterium]|nr:hypothetical protein [Sedimentisphaerales bacterium]
MSFYKIFMLIMVPVLAIGWFFYWRWTKKMDEEEKKQPKPVSKTKKEVSDWAKKMATFDSPAEQARKRKLEQEKQWEEIEKKRQQEKQQ